MDLQELELAGVDVKELLDRLMNNEKLLNMVVGKFLEDRSFAQLQAAVEAGDWKGAEFASHSLKGVCGNLSLKELFALTQEQVTLLRKGKPAEAAAMMEAVSMTYANARQHLQQWLDRQ